MTEFPRPPDDLYLRVLAKMGGADEEDYLVFDRSGHQSAQELRFSRRPLGAPWAALPESSTSAVGQGESLGG